MWSGRDVRIGIRLRFGRDAVADEIVIAKDVDAVRDDVAVGPAQADVTTDAGATAGGGGGQPLLR